MIKFDMPQKDKKKYNKYQKTYQINRYHKRRKDAIIYLRNKCVVCGSESELELDHINPSSKRFSIAKMWSINKKSFWEEVEKCQLLCKTHHKLKSDEELSHKIIFRGISYASKREAVRENKIGWSTFYKEFEKDCL